MVGFLGLIFGPAGTSGSAAGAAATLAAGGVAGAGAAAAGAAGVGVSGVASLIRFAPLPLPVPYLNATSNSVAAKNYVAGTALLCHRRKATTPAGREQRLDERSCCGGQFGSVTEPPGFRDARQTVHINIF